MPGVCRVWLPQVTSSATIEAFQAAPLAVTAPVIQALNMAGSRKRRQRWRPLSWNTWLISRRSFGMALAPAVTLNNTYHWAPMAINTTQP